MPKEQSYHSRQVAGLSFRFLVVAVAFLLCTSNVLSQQNSCVAVQGGYPTCMPALGPASVNGADANLGYDINAATGNLFLPQPDIHAHPALGPDLDFIRYYNSQGNGADIGLGPNWTHTFSWSLTLFSMPRVIGSKAQNPLQAMVVADTGQVHLFTFQKRASIWFPQPGEFGSLTTVLVHLIAAKDITTYVYTTKFGIAYTFDTTGRLLSIKPGDNTAITITYSSGTQISQVTSGGLSLVFSYTGKHISSITDPAGAQWQYAYSPASGIPWFVPQVLLSQAGTGGVQTVTAPLANATPGAVHGTTLYAYGPQTMGGTTFSPGTGSTGALTGYAVVTSGGGPPPPRGTTIRLNAAQSILGLFSYTNSAASVTAVAPGTPMVVEAASGIVAGKLLRDVQMTYGNGGVAVATVNGGIKTISSTSPFAGYFRLSQIVSTAGSGTPGELTAEAWTWNSNLTLASHKDGNNNVTLFGSYDSLGNPTTITEASGTPQARTTTLTYHPVLSRPLSIARASVDGIAGHQHILTWDYDSDYNTSYNQSPTNYVHQVVESGYTDNNLAGGLGKLETHTVQIKYSSLNQVTSISGPTTQLTTYSYSPTGYPATESRATGTTTLTTNLSGYDADGRLTNVNDANGNINLIKYDLEGFVTNVQVISADQSQASSETYVRDLAENVIQRRTMGGLVVTQLDPGLRPVEIIAYNLAGTAVWSRVTDFDSFGKPVTVRTFSGIGTDQGPGCTPAGTEQFCKDFAYDPYERLQSVHTLDTLNNSCSTSPQNCTTYYTYDGNGNLLTSGDYYNGATTNTIDALNHIISIRSKAGGLWTLTYDLNDNMIGRRDPMDPRNGGWGANGRVSSYLYDDFGRVVSVSTPDIGQWYSVYDLAGNLSANKDNSGATLNYTYDGLNRRTVVQSPSNNESVTFVYDETGYIAATAMTATPLLFANTMGRLTSMQALDPNGNKIWDHFTYDYLGGTTNEVMERTNVFGSFVSTTQYARGASHELKSVTYPDGVVVSYQYSSQSLSAPTMRPNEIDVSFNGNSTTVASGITYFPDGKVQGLLYGSGSVLSITRNKRGEVTAINSGPPNSATAVVQQNYVYASNVIGEVNQVNFFPNQPKQNQWQWQMSYNRLGALSTYSTNVRPTTDNYGWSYDEVGNRTQETYNGQTRQYCYDVPMSASNPSCTGYLTNQLRSASGNSVLNAASLSGSGTIIGYMALGYDQNGNVSQDSVAYNSNNQGVLSYPFLYNSRHHLKEIDQSTGTLGGGSSQQSLVYQQNYYDGLDRVAEIYCPSQPGTQGAFGFCSQVAGQISGSTGSQNGPIAGGTCDQLYQLSCTNGVGLYCIPTHGTEGEWTSGYNSDCPATGVSYGPGLSNGGTAANAKCPNLSNGSPPPAWEFLYYDPKGQLLEEFANNNLGAYGYPAYDVTDHVYLGGVELGRVVLQYQSLAGFNNNPTSCVSNANPGFTAYSLQESNVLYLHHDNRNALIAVESQNPNPPKNVPGLPKLVWEAEVSPFGQAITIGVRGGDGKIGSPNTQPDDIVSQGVAGALPNGSLGSFLVVPGEEDPSAGLSLSPSSNLWIPSSGWSVYVGDAGAPGPGGIGSGDRGATLSPLNGSLSGPTDLPALNVSTEAAAAPTLMGKLSWTEDEVDEYAKLLALPVLLASGMGKVPADLMPGIKGLGDAWFLALLPAGLAVATTKAFGLYGQQEYFTYENTPMMRLMFPPPATMAQSMAQGQRVDQILSQYYGTQTGGYGSPGYRYSSSVPPIAIVEGGPFTSSGPDFNLQQPGQACLSDPACSSVVQEYDNDSTPPGEGPQ
jgi:YD repeat-containing protein